MPYTTDPAERAILTGFQRAINDLAATVVTYESTTVDPFILARLGKIVDIRATGTLQLAAAIEYSGTWSPEFVAELHALAELLNDVLPDLDSCVTVVDWDAELGALGGAA